MKICLNQETFCDSKKFILCRGLEKNASQYCQCFPVNFTDSDLGSVIHRFAIHQ